MLTSATEVRRTLSSISLVLFSTLRHSRIIMESYVSIAAVLALTPFARAALMRSSHRGRKLRALQMRPVQPVRKGVGCLKDLAEQVDDAVVAAAVACNEETESLQRGNRNGFQR